METLTIESCTAALVRTLESQYTSPAVYSVEDLTVIEGQHMPDEARVTATCHYTKDSTRQGDSTRWQVEFYFDCFDEIVYVDSQL